MRTIIPFALAVIASLGVVACGSKQEPAQEPLVPEPPVREKPIGSAPECVDAENNPIRCEADDECCPGFVCGIDPELSSRIKHCIYGG